MNPHEIMKNLHGLQSKMGEFQQKLKTLRQEGSSGGDLVQVTVDGTMEAVSVHINPIAVDPRDIQMLEELIAAAFTDAVRKMQDKVQNEMTEVAGGLGLPPGFMGGGPH